MEDRNIHNYVARIGTLLIYRNARFSDRMKTGRYVNRWGACPFWVDVLNTQLGINGDADDVKDHVTDHVADHVNDHVADHVADVTDHVNNICPPKDCSLKEWSQFLTDCIGQRYVFIPFETEANYARDIHIARNSSSLPMSFQRVIG